MDEAEPIDKCLFLLHSDLANGELVGFWVGLYHLNQDDPWKWVDGSETDFINWRPGQPNKNDTELCALAESGQDAEGLLDDYPCTDSFNYACEYTPSKGREKIRRGKLFGTMEVAFRYCR